ncbi:MAG: hypothetical protein KDI10_07075 [Halioglobus sp.]|nr:hypothetical protein [Halioglobus sp.]
MLSESSYLAAMYAYIGAGLAIMLCLGWWLSRHWSAGWVALAVLLTGALLLTPAYPREGVDTFAPALIVAVFQYVTEGIEGAGHALKPLAFSSLVAVILALLLRLTLFRGGRRTSPPAQKNTRASG